MMKSFTLLTTIGCLLIPQAVLAQSDTNRSPYVGVFHGYHNNFKFNGFQARFASDHPEWLFSPALRIAMFHATNTLDREYKNKEGYTSIEGGIGVRVGYPVYASAEFGLDVLETAAAIILNDDEDDDDKDDEEDRFRVDVDYYVSFGVGATIKKLDIQAVTRYRHVSGFHVETHQDWFSGLEIGYKF